MQRFFIVRHDGQVYDSERDGPSKLPIRGVQVIVQQHPDVGWHVQTGYDFYIWRDGRFVGVDRAGLWDYLEDRGSVKINIGHRHEVRESDKWVTVDEFGLYKWLEYHRLALFGRTLTTKSYREALKTAMDIRQVQMEKSGYIPGEPRV